MNRSEIWLLNLDPTVGAEMRKTRPVIIVNDDRVGKLPLRVVIPITDWNSVYSKVAWMVKLVPDAANGLSKDSAADCFQVRSVSQQRFVRKIGDVNVVKMSEIEKALAVVLKI